MFGRYLNSICILVISLTVVIFFHQYGKYCRIFIHPYRIVQVASTTELYNLFESSGVRGRILIILSRKYILGEHEYVSPAVKEIERAVQHGIVRKIYNIIPDDSWPEINWNLSLVSNYWKTASGFAGAFEDWRVNVVPYSRFIPPEEKSLVVVDPQVFTTKEYEQIALRIKNGNLNADIIAIINGTQADLKVLTDIVKNGERTRPVSPLGAAK